MSESENEKTTAHPTRDLITWIVATLTAVVALVGGVIALFHSAKRDHPTTPSVAMNQVGPGSESGVVENASAPGGVIGGVIHGNITTEGR